MHTLSFVYSLNTYYVYYPNRRILKSLGLFENLAIVIMSTRENIRLIARAHGSKIVLVRSYLRVSQAAGQVNILIFLLKINFSPCMPIHFVMQGKCLFSDISRPGASASSITKGATQYTLYFRREYSMDRSSIFGYNVNVGALRPPVSGILSARKTPSFMHPLKASIKEFWRCPANILRLYSIDRH